MSAQDLPLSGLTIVERSSTVAAAYAGRILATLGARTIIIEPPGGHELRHRAPMLVPDSSSIFTFLAAGKESRTLDLTRPEDRRGLDVLLTDADVYIDDAAAEERERVGVGPHAVMSHHHALTYISVRPFGLYGPKAGWSGEEITIFHASGEAGLLPNGLAYETHPERPPLKVFGYFAEMQGGLTAALGALASAVAGVGQLVDVSVQDAAVAVGAFTIQRYGDGSTEHRSTRSFRYGGVLECHDGFVELLTLEDRQWDGLMQLLGEPEWATQPEMRDALGRGAHGLAINERLRAWAREQETDDLVARAQALGVPTAKYATPLEVVRGVHETHRGLFQGVAVPGLGDVEVFTAPYHFDGEALPLLSGPPATDSHCDSLEPVDVGEVAR